MLCALWEGNTFPLDENTKKSRTTLFSLDYLICDPTGNRTLIYGMRTRCTNRYTMGPCIIFLIIVLPLPARIDSQSDAGGYYGAGWPYYTIPKTAFPRLFSKSTCKCAHNVYCQNPQPLLPLPTRDFRISHT
jgi:hypothetical protein